MAPILLVHGAWHGAWCWDRVIPALAKRGRRASAIDLPGAGDDPTPLAEVTLDRYARRIVEALEDLGAPAVLVGHSMGGVSISAAADLAPERIAKLVYLCAALPPEEASTLDPTAETFRAGSLMEMQVSEDGLSVTVVEEVVRAACYADCSDVDVAFAKARLKPLPAQLLAAVAQVTAKWVCRAPRIYIECTEDRTIPIALQRAMVAASPPIEVHTLNTSHSPFFSAPEALADVLAKL